jgi:hypothetical protein
MWDLATLNTINAEMTRKARAKRTQLIALKSEKDVDDLLDGKNGPLPNVGDYVPTGWEEAMTPLFVDSSGFGSPGERALTITQLRARLKELVAENPAYKYGVVSQGQFQLHLGVFTRTKKDK